MRKFMFMLLLLLIPSAVFAQPITAWKQRSQVSANGSFMWFSRFGGGYDNWQGGDLGGTFTYNLHQRFSVFTAYDHGFPFTENDGHLNFVRLMASLNVYNSGGSNPNSVFIGAGKGWFGRNTIKDWDSYEAQVVASHGLSPRTAVFASYAHSFLTEPGEPDFDFAKAGLNVRLLP